ncbi:MAG: hypothetical protein WC869_09870 [Phycisphaerae bacterium]|jgi:hypothetical protein
MKSKKPNLVAGRLDAAPTKRPETTAATSRKDVEYGVDRLGITADGGGQPAGVLSDSVLSDNSILQLPLVRPTLAAPAVAAPALLADVAALAVSEQPTVTAPEPISPWQDFNWDQHLAQTQVVKASFGQKFASAASSLAQQCLERAAAIGQLLPEPLRKGRNGLMILGGSAGLVLCLVALLSWGTGNTPRAASAEPAVVIPDTAPLDKARQAAKERSDLAVLREGKGKTADLPKVWEVLGPVDNSDAPGTFAEDSSSGKGGKELLATIAPSTATKPVTADKTGQVTYREPPGGLSLRGVVHAPDGLLANINSTFVPVGGVVNNAKIIAINDYSVEMELAGQRFVLGIGSAAPAVESEAAEPPPAADEAEPDQPRHPAARSAAAPSDPNAAKPAKKAAQSSHKTPSASSK